MARDFAISYGTRTRPAGQPAGNMREVRSERHAISRERNLARINPTPTHDPKPSGSVCKETTKAGEPCKARPAEGSDICPLHARLGE